MSEKKTFTIKDARVSDIDAFDKLKDDRGFTATGAFSFLIEKSKNKDADEDLRKENKELLAKNKSLQLQAERDSKLLTDLEAKVVELASRKPEEKEIERELKPGEFIIELSKDTFAHLEKATDKIKKASGMSPEAFVNKNAEKGVKKELRDWYL